MPEETGLDTSIPQTGWQNTGRDSDAPTQKRRGQKPRETPHKPEGSPRPRPADGVGTRIDVIA